jgi:hypothetical protein
MNSNWRKEQQQIGIGNEFLSRTQTTQQLKRKNWQMDYMKLKGFCTTKEMVSRLKRQHTEWEKIFASYIFGKWLIAGIYRELKNLNSPKIEWPNKEMGKWTQQSLFKGRSPNGQKHMKKCSKTPGHKADANQNHIKIPIHSVRMAIIKSTNSKC